MSRSSLPPQCALLFAVPLVGAACVGPAVERLTGEAAPIDVSTNRPIVAITLPDGSEHDVLFDTAAPTGLDLPAATLDEAGVGDATDIDVLGAKLVRVLAVAQPHELLGIFAWSTARVVLDGVHSEGAFLGQGMAYAPSTELDLEDEIVTPLVPVQVTYSINDSIAKDDIGYVLVDALLEGQPAQLSLDTGCNGEGVVLFEGHADLVAADPARPATTATLTSTIDTRTVTVTRLAQVAVGDLVFSSVETVVDGRAPPRPVAGIAAGVLCYGAMKSYLLEVDPTGLLARWSRQRDAAPADETRWWSTGVVVGLVNDRAEVVELKRADTGLEVGHVVVSIDGTPAADMDEETRAAASSGGVDRQLGQTVTFVVRRGDADVAVDVAVVDLLPPFPAAG